MSGQVCVLVVPAVVACGIDVDGLSPVVNYTVPATVEDCLQRVGRAA